MVSFEVSNSSELRYFISVFKSRNLSPHLNVFRNNKSILTVKMVISVNVYLQVTIIIVLVESVNSEH